MEWPCRCVLRPLRCPPVHNWMFLESFSDMKACRAIIQRVALDDSINQIAQADYLLAACGRCPNCKVSALHCA